MFTYNNYNHNNLQAMILQLKLGKTGIPTAKQRRKFYEFALAIYTGNIVEIDAEGDSLDAFGFCNLYRNVFKYKLFSDKFSEVLPELYQYKPSVFYDAGGYKTSDDSQFWFPRAYNSQRAEILTKVLAQEF